MSPLQIALCFTALFFTVLPSSVADEVEEDDEKVTEYQITTKNETFNPIIGSTIRLPCKVEPEDGDAIVSWMKHFDVEYIMIGSIPSFKDRDYPKDKFYIERPHDLIIRNVSSNDIAWYTCKVLQAKSVSVDHNVASVRTENET